MFRSGRETGSASALAVAVAATLLGCGGPAGGGGGADTPDLATDPAPDLSGGSPEPGAVVLTDVTKSAGLPAAAPRCLVFRDFDHDARADILLAGIDTWAQFSHELDLYRNKGDGTFERHAIPLPGLDGVRHCSAGDFDNDGWVDLAVGGMKDRKPGLVLLRNTGGSGYEFADVTGAAGATLVGTLDTYIEGMGFCDYDGDGWLDLFAGYWATESDIRGMNCKVTADDFYCLFADPAPRAYPPSILHNDGGRSFAPSPLGASGPTAVPHWVNAFGFVDWDGDGRTDVFQANDFERSVFFHNLAGGPADYLPGWNANPVNHAMGVAFGDFDHDGRWDFYVVDAGPDQFYFGTPDGGVRNRAAEVGIADATRYHAGWSPVAADLNNDGWLDVFVANTAIVTSSDELGKLFRSGLGLDGTTAMQGDYLFTSRGGKRFETTFLPNPGLVPSPANAAAAAADFNGDGLLDIATVEYTLSGRVRLLRNDTNSRGAHWLKVRLVGRTANADGVGAVVVLHDGARELDRRGAGQGGPGNSDSVVHFGLGPIASVPALTVHWPGADVQEVAGPIAADQLLTVEQK